MNEEHLISLIKENPCLYNLQHKDYDNNLVKEYVWNDISGKLNFNVDDCKSKWALLRSYYRRALHRRKTLTGQEVKKLKRWRFDEQMQFLKPYLQEKKSRRSGHTLLSSQKKKLKRDELHEKIEEFILQEEKEVIVSENLGEIIFQGKQEREDQHKNLIFQGTKINHADENPKKSSLMNFFSDIAETITKFPNLEQAKIKREIFNLVTNKEIELLENNTETYIEHEYIEYLDE